MKIQKRVSDGRMWVSGIENKGVNGKNVCDKCGKKLWVNPGKVVYCNTDGCGDEK